MASPALSQASTAFESDVPQIQDDQKPVRRVPFQRAKEAATSQDVLLFLIAFRTLNALSIRTFFQPDEYYQSLEPAWEIAFGANGGAWITWVCEVLFLLPRTIADRWCRNGRTSCAPPSTQLCLPAPTGFVLRSRSYCS